MTEREAPRLFQILTLLLIAIAIKWQSINVASGIPGEPFKVWCACIASCATKITSSVMVCANYCITRGNDSGCFLFAFSRHLAPFGAPSQRPHCRRKDRIRLCPCKMDRVLQIQCGSDSGHTCNVAVTHIGFCAIRYRTGHWIFSRISSLGQPLSDRNHSPTADGSLRSSRDDLDSSLFVSERLGSHSAASSYALSCSALQRILTGLLYLSKPSDFF